MPVSSVTEHWIKKDALTINLNHFGDPDYLQVSLLAGAVVMAFKQDVIGYDAAHNYRTWPLEAANTYLENTTAFHVYAKLTRSEVNAKALIIYDPVLRDIEGREITYKEDESTSEEETELADETDESDTSEDTTDNGDTDSTEQESDETLGEADEDFFYIYLGKISASVTSSGSSVTREWEDGFYFGTLNTNQNQNEDSLGEWSKMFRLNKVTDMIDVLKTFSSAIFKKLSIKKNDTEKVITDIKRSVDGDDVPDSDETIPTTKYLSSFTNEKYLRKDQDDRSVGTISSDKGFEVGTFQEGTLGSGAAMYQDEDKNTYMEADFLKIRKKATFTTITVQELKHVGGEIILSPATMICSKVEETTIGYKCYFNKEDSDGRKVYQEFEVGDQARCQIFNLVPQEDGTLGSRYYWRLVIEVGEDYIVLSKTDCDTNSDIPLEGDHICLMGNRNDETRQSAILLSAYGSDAPSYKQYNGIKSYVLADAELVTKFSPSGNIIKGTLLTESGKNVSDELEGIKVDWDKVLSQTDKEFTMWFYAYEPTMDNAPAVDWTTEDLKELHDQDLFYDTESGLAYRFECNDGVWGWYIVTDAETIKALEKAAKAQEKADEVGASLDEIVSDGILSALEKKTVLREWQEIVAEYTNNVETSNNFGLGFDDTDNLEMDDILVEYRDTYIALGTYLNDGYTWDGGTPKWLSDQLPENADQGELAPLYQNTSIVAAEFRQYWVSYDNAKKLLLNHLSKIAKQKADKANQELTDIASDSVLSAVEKKTVYMRWEEALDSYADNIVNAAPYDLTDYTSQYKSRLEAFGTILNGKSAWTVDSGNAPLWLDAEHLGTNTDMDEYGVTLNDFIGAWVNLKAAEIALLDAITKAVEKKADDANNKADEKKRVFVSQPTSDSVYDVGDLWMNASYGEMYVNETLVCKTAKEKGTPFSINHWKSAVDGTTSYIQQLRDEITLAVTDSDKGIEAAKELANQAISDAAKAMEEIGYTNQDVANVEGVVSEHTTAIQANKDSIAVLSGRVDYDESTGKIKNIDTSGLVTGNGDFATLFAQSVDDEGLAKRADVSVIVTDEMAKAVIKGDQIDLVGYTVINGKFAVDESGNVHLTNAYVSGEIVANTGNIAGFNISGNSLTNEGFDNDASIIFRNDSYNLFAGLGGNVLPAFTGQRALARIENHDDSDMWGLSANYAMILSARGSIDNTALLMNGGCIEGFALKTLTIAYQNVTQSSAPTLLEQTIGRNIGSVFVSTQFNWRSSSSGTYTVKTRDVKLTLPEMQVYDDGHTIKIKRGVNDGNTVSIIPGSSWIRTSGFKYKCSSVAQYINISGHSLPSGTTIDLYVKLNGVSSVYIALYDSSKTLISNKMVSSDGVYSFSTSSGTPYYLYFGYGTSVGDVAGVEVTCVYSGMTSTWLVDYPRTSFILYNEASYATPSSPLVIEGQGDAMELVYHRALQHTEDGTTYYGCWVQYKHPRVW